jgi:hemerythrin-like metal-binding protein
MFFMKIFKRLIHLLFHNFVNKVLKMEYIKWNDGYSVGIETIDNQHRELFNLINVFYNGISAKLGKQAILKAIIDLEKYTVVHFSFEEFMMKQSGYPFIEEHIKEHQAFIETVADFRKRYENDRLLLSLEVSGFIRKWINSHIMNTDHLYKGKILPEYK